LSAGAIQSPQLLQLSGVGDPSELAKYGIETIVNSPGTSHTPNPSKAFLLPIGFHTEVGQNLQDHQMVPANFRVSSNDTVDSLADPTVLAYWMGVYNSTGGGRLVDTFGNSAAFVRASTNLTNTTLWQSHGDTAPGPNSPHIELVFAVSRSKFKIYRLH
jgi:choline dehydrogenase-like flavoprotein